MSPDEQAVLAANEAFYRAFSERDHDAMRALWSARDDVAVIHPGWPALRGREAVLESWRRIMEGPGSPRIQCEDATATVIGDAAFVVCLERLPEGELVATNVFARENGAWKLAHHQAGATPAVPLPDPGGTVH